MMKKVACITVLILSWVKSSAQIGPTTVFRVIEADSLRAGKVVDSANVRMYGARGNGISDDAVPIQRAVDSVSRTGGSVILPVGTYVISSPIELQSNVKLVGAGFGSTVLKKRGSTGKAVIKVSGAHHFEITGVTVRNNSADQDSSGNAIDIDNGSHDGIVSNCLIDSSWNGIVISGLESQSGYNIGIFNNIIKDVGENGIGANIRSTTGIQISGNHIYNYGIHSHGIVGAGIEYRGGSGGVIADNIIENAPYYPEEEANDGIRLENVTESPSVQSRSTVISGNVIRNISGHGLRIQLATDCIISGNRIDSSRYGITLLSSSFGRSKNNNITGNVITNQTSHALYVVGSLGYEVENTLISSNVFAASQASAIYLTHALNAVFKDNLIADGFQQGIYDTDSKHNVYEGNIFINNGTLYAHVALSLINSDSAIIAGGKIYQGKIVTSAGIYIDSTSDGVRLSPMPVIGSTVAYINSSRTSVIPEPAFKSDANTFTAYGNSFSHGIQVGDSITFSSALNAVATGSRDGADNTLLMLSAASDAGTARAASIVMRGNEYPDPDSGKMKMYGLNGIEIYTGPSGVTAIFDYFHNLTLAGTYNGLTLTKNVTGFSISGGVTSKTLSALNTLSLSGTDGSTLDIGAGGTLTQTAFTSLGSFAMLAGYNRFTHAVTFADSIILQNTTTNIVTNTADGADNKLLGISSAGAAGASRGASLVLRGNEYPDGDAGKFKAYAGTSFEFYSGSSGLTAVFDASHNALFYGSVTSTGFKLSAIQTAPATSSSAGVAGEIRFTPSGIYICTATNTWVKAVAATF